MICGAELEVLCVLLELRNLTAAFMKGFLDPDNFPPRKNSAYANELIKFKDNTREGEEFELDFMEFCHVLG
jgi:hypothetical protein